jgi:septum formation protein
MLVLASTSVYRAELLSRLRLPFSVCPSGVDERHIAGEAPIKRSRRLALLKAGAGYLSHAETAPHAWVLGSDQVAVCEGRILDKPGTPEQAIEQLRWQSGKYTLFLTSVALRGQDARSLRWVETDTTLVGYRKLTLKEIEAYVAAEPALDCAGSAKVEGLGISLCQDIQSRDPTALIGLPLILTGKLLRRAGVGKD